MADRAFADPAYTRLDLATLERMRVTLRRRSRPGTWRDAEGEHWLVAPEPGRLLEAAPARGVGFFGQSRAEVDHTPISRLEHELLDRAGRFPGLLAYHNVRFTSGQWGNLVVFADEDGPGHVRDDPTHLEALRLTPSHYHSLRLHRVLLPDGALGPAPLELVETLLLDFAETPPWREVRA